MIVSVKSTNIISVNCQPREPEHFTLYGTLAIS